MQLSQNSQQNRIRVNYQIRVPQVRVILNDGSNAGIMDTRDALALAQEQGFDLVEINPRSSPPTTRLINYGKYKYELKKQQSEAKKNQKTQELKELSFRPSTDDNDLLILINKAKQFLLDKNSVKLLVKHRGREIVHPEIAKEKLAWCIQQLGDNIQPDPKISAEGKFIFVIVYPKK